MLWAMGSIATQLAKFGKRNFVAGFALALPLLNRVRRWEQLEMVPLSCYSDWLACSSPHILGIVTMLWDLTVETSNLPQRLCSCPGSSP